MRFKVAAVLAFLLLLVFGVVFVLDRVAERMAEGRVAEQIASRGQLAGTPDVDIAGWPFLTQAIAGNYQDVRIDLTAEELGQPAGTQADVALHGVHVGLRDALAGRVSEIPVDRVDGTATLSYDLLSQKLGGGARLTPDGDRVRVTRTVKVAGVSVPVTASGTVALKGQDLVVDVGDATAAGVDVPRWVLEQAAGRMDLRYRVPALPFGLQLTGVQPSADGVHVQVLATDTVLRG